MGHISGSESYAETTYFLATSCSLSTLTLAKASFPGLDSVLASCSKTGAIARQGPHQSAQKSTTT